MVPECLVAKSECDALEVLWSWVLDCCGWFCAYLACRVRLFVGCDLVRRVANACDAFCRLRRVCLWHCPFGALHTPGMFSVLWAGLGARDGARDAAAESKFWRFASAGRYRGEISGFIAELNVCCSCAPVPFMVSLFWGQAADLLRSGLHGVLVTCQDTPLFSMEPSSSSHDDK